MWYPKENRFSACGSTDPENCKLCKKEKKELVIDFSKPWVQSSICRIRDSKLKTN